jgi:hypothetical protein
MFIGVRYDMYWRQVDQLSLLLSAQAHLSTGSYTGRNSRSDAVIRLELNRMGQVFSLNRRKATLSGQQSSREAALCRYLHTWLMIKQLSYLVQWRKSTDYIAKHYVHHY